MRIPDLSKVPRRDLNRWICELMVALAVGIAAGCIAFALLYGEKKENESLTPSATLESEETETTTEETADDSSEDTETDESEEVEQEEVADAYMGSYADSLSGMSTEEIDAIISERADTAATSSYWDAISTYWEEVRGVTDTSCYCMYLFDTDETVYTTADFDGVSAEVIHIAKNEIYARHGYSFNDSDLYNYFMGQAWYDPTVLPEDFSEDVFSEIEVQNLDMLNSIDTY